MRPITTVLVSLVLTLSLASAMAQDSRAAKAERISLSLGIGEMLKHVQQMNIESTKQQMQVVISELRNGGVPEDRLIMFAALAEQMAQRVASAWDPKEASRIYSDGLVESLSVPELSEAENYFATSQGRKTQAAITASQSRMAEYINAKTNAALQEEFGKFMAQVKQVAKAKP